MRTRITYAPSVGFFFRLLAPKPFKQARRAFHPVSLLTPRPVRNVKRAVAKTVNPIGALGDAFENQALKVARGKKRRSRSGGGSGGSTSRATASSGPVYVEYEDDYVDEAPLTEAEERERLGFRPLTLKSARQSETLELQTEDGAVVAVTVADVLDPAQPRRDYDLPSAGEHLVAVRFLLQNKGPGVFAYDPSYESKLIGASGGEYRSWEADLTVPTFNDVVRLGVGAKRSAYVCYVVADEDRPETAEIVFGIDLHADIGQWTVEEVTDTTEPAQTSSTSVPPRTAPPTKPRPTEAPADDEQALLARMLADPDASKRQAAAAALTRKADPATRGLLLKALKDPDFEVRTHALKGLVTIGGEGLVAALRAALQDSHPYLREKAVKALAVVGDAEAVEAIRSAKSDADESVRQAADRALGQTDPK
jgi:hypothetical protein